MATANEAAAAPAAGEMRVRNASDGYPLHCRYWTPAGPRRGSVLTLHGIQSHSGWYVASGDRLSQDGWEVLAPDRRGSGANPLQRGDVSDFRRWLNDVRHFLFDMHQSRRQRGDTFPIVLTGISWGAKLAWIIAQESPELVDGLVLITPGLFPQVAPSRWDRCRIATARRLNIRDRRVPIPLSDPALFTSLSEGQAWIAGDPMALHDMTLGFLYGSQDLDRLIRRNIGVSVPVMLFLAEHDRIIDNPRTIAFLKQQVSADLQVKTYAGVEHSLELEACRQEFLADWVRWCEELERKHRTSGSPEIPRNIK